eukprot:467024-Prorocentrum_minimum.AAC.4
MDTDLGTLMWQLSALAKSKIPAVDTDVSNLWGTFHETGSIFRSEETRLLILQPRIRADQPFVMCIVSVDIHIFVRNSAVSTQTEIVHASHEWQSM